MREVDTRELGSYEGVLWLHLLGVDTLSRPATPAILFTIFTSMRGTESTSDLIPS